VIVLTVVYFICSGMLEIMETSEESSAANTGSAVAANIFTIPVALLDTIFYWWVSPRRFFFFFSIPC
jgi:hypothetical protein